MPPMDWQPICVALIQDSITQPLIRERLGSAGILYVLSWRDVSYLDQMRELRPEILIIVDHDSRRATDSVALLAAILTDPLPSLLSLTFAEEEEGDESLLLWQVGARQAARIGSLAELRRND